MADTSAPVRVTLKEVLARLEGDAPLYATAVVYLDGEVRFHGIACRDAYIEAARTDPGRPSIENHTSLLEAMVAWFGDTATDNHQRYSPGWWAEIAMCDSAVLVLPCCTLPDILPNPFEGWTPQDELQDELQDAAPPVPASQKVDDKDAAAVLADIENDLAEAVQVLDDIEQALEGPAGGAQAEETAPEADGSANDTTIDRETAPEADATGNGITSGDEAAPAADGTDENAG